MIHDVADVDIIGLVQSDAVRLRELRLGCRAIIAGVTAYARSRSRRNHSRLHVDVSHHVAITLCDVNVSFAVETNFMRRAELRRFRGAAVAGITFRTIAGNDINRSHSQIESQDTIAAKICPVQSAVRANHYAERIVDERPASRLAVGCGSGSTGAGDRGHSCGGALWKNGSEDQCHEVSTCLQGFHGATLYP